MPSSSSLVLLPPRQTAQAPQASSKSQKTAGDDSFAPKLEQARKQQHAAKPVAPTAAKMQPVKPAAATPVAGKPVAEESEKDPSSPDGQGKKQNLPQEPGDSAEAPPDVKLPVPTSAAGTAIAQAAAPIEKKAVKPAKPTANKPSAAPTANPANLLNPAKPADTSAADGDNPEVADNASASSSDPPAAIGGGFYGSGKVVERAAADTADDAADVATAAEGDAAAAASDSAEDPQAGVAAEIATDAPAVKSTAAPGARTDTATVLNALTAASTGPSAIAGKAAVTVSPQANFAAANHPTIVSSIAGQLLPKGGTMQIRLDPPELGALQVTVHMKDGVMTASFQTSNDDATKMLSRSLGQLKSGLEAAGMSVDKLTVEQTPRQNNQQNTDGNSHQPAQDQQQQAQQDQQRRELVQRMWRKLAGGGDPLDLVA